MRVKERFVGCREGSAGIYLARKVVSKQVGGKIMICVGLVIILRETSCAYKTQIVLAIVIAH